MRIIYTFCFFAFILAIGSLNAQEITITINVNMANYEVNETGVFVAGGDSFGVPGDNPMTDVNNDGIWTASFTRPSGFTGNYTFTNGNSPDYSGKENIAGLDCADGQFNDRLIPVTTEDLVINTCFGQCSTDGSCEPLADPVEITFQVNTAEETVGADDVVYIFGNPINGWCPDCTPMSDDNDDGIYDVTLELPAGVVEYKYFIGSVQESLDPTEDSSCTTTTATFTNRTYTVGDESEVLTPDCFNACGNCGDVVEPTIFDVTFKVDMSDVSDEFTTPEVNGTFNAWCGNCNPMTDEGNGIWSTVISLEPGTYEFKYSADIWTIQEDLVGLTGCDILQTEETWNRFVVVEDENVELDVVCWSTCASCDVSVNEFAGKEFTIYPNPISEGDLIIEGDLTNSNVSVYNTLGVLVKIIPSEGLNKLSFSVNELNSGVYFMKNENGAILGSFVKK